MTVACILVGVLVLLAAGLVIYNILKISITKRIKEYGTLRAIGGQRGQIYRLVSVQLLILCGAGLPVGLLIGTLSAKGALIAATGVLNPEIFMANSTSELNSAISAASTVKLPMLFASVAVTLIFAMLAAFPAARYASRVSPTVAMSGQTVKIRRRVKKNRTIRNFDAYYARLSLKRGRGRTVVTILSLVMSITVFVALQSFTGLLDASSSIQNMYSGDYAITNETVGIPAEAVKTLEANDAVEGVSTTDTNYVRLIQEWEMNKNGCIPWYKYKEASYTSTWYLKESNTIYQNFPLGYNYSKLKYHCYLKLLDSLPVFCGFGVSVKDARMAVCKLAYEYLEQKDLLWSIRNEIENPNRDDSINQLEILARRGYFSIPTYAFEETYDHNGNPIWKCECHIVEEDCCFDGTSSSKKEAKKDSAFRMLFYVLGMEGE